MKATQSFTVRPALPDELAGLWTRQEPIPWAPGARNLVLAITPDHVTGRVIT